MGIPWQPMHIEIFPFAASGFPVCARAARGNAAQSSTRVSVFLIGCFVVMRKPDDFIRCTEERSKPSRETALEALRDGPRDALARLLGAHPQLLVAVDDHSGLEEHRGGPRGLEDDQVVVVVHSVRLVGEGLVLP